MRLLAILALVVLVGAGCGADATKGSPPMAPESGAPPSDATQATAPTLTPSSSPTPATTPSSTPAPTPTGEVRWDQIGAIPEAVSGEHESAVGFEDGYVVIHGTSTIQFSPDGVTWTPVRLPLAKGPVLRVGPAATDGMRVLVVGNYTPCRKAAWDKDRWGPCRGRPISWVSDDGRTWRGSDTWTGPVGPVGQSGSTFGSVWAVPTGGWDAAQVFDTSDDTDVGFGVGPALWHSADGITWSLLRAAPTQSDTYWAADAFWALADKDGRRVAVEEVTGPDGDVPSDPSAPAPTQGPILSISTDGRRYERLTDTPDGSMRAGLAPLGAGPWVFAGERPVSKSAYQGLAWASEDLVTWTTTVMPVPRGTVGSTVGALGHTATGLVAIGRVNTRGSDRPVSVTWLSDDGRTWRIADVGSSDAMDESVVAHGPAGTLGFGFACSGSDCKKVTTSVWRLGSVR